jgi:hypothetical protein
MLVRARDGKASCAHECSDALGYLGDGLMETSNCCLRISYARQGVGKD